MLAQIGATMIAVPPDSARWHSVARDSPDTTVGVVVADSGAPVPGPDSMFGLSGKLRAHFLSTARHVLDLPILRRYFGDTAADSPGV